MQFITIEEYDFALFEERCKGLSAKHISSNVSNLNEIQEVELNVLCTNC